MNSHYFKLKEFTDEALDNRDLIAKRKINGGTILECHGWRNGDNVNWRFFYQDNYIGHLQAIRLLDQ